MIKISKDIIIKHKACEEGLDNYVKYFGEGTHDFKTILESNRIPYNDKIWALKSF